MFGLKIYLKTEDGRRYVIPAPIWLVKAALGMSGFWIGIAKKHIPAEHLHYIEDIDFKEMKKAFDVLKAYDGLNMIDIRSKDGKEVKIVI